jgi:hypothetical protein
MPPTDDDGPFEVDDLLWLIREMEDQSAPSHEMLLEDCAAREIPMTERRLARVIAEAAEAGLVEIWAEGALYVTLTPLAAERMGVELTIDSGRWLPRGKLYQEKLSSRPGEEWSPRDPTSYVDPTLPEPLDVLVDLETRGALIAPGHWWLRDGSTLKVGHVHGIGVEWPWALLAAPGEPCRGCGGRRLARGAYCAICHNSGVDGLLPAVEPALKKDGQVRPPAEDLYVYWPKPATPAGPKLSGGLGTKVKSRKKAKNSAA